jgi:CP family cyanate transporter-like MFS transporter
MRMAESAVRRGARTRWLAAAGLALVAFNLRPAVTSIGPVLAEARAGLGMSAAVAGLLASVAVLCFALVGGVAPRLARRFPPTAVVAVATAVTAAGLTARTLAPGAVLFLALSAIALAGIAVVNVLLPGVVRERFPDRIGTMTGLYTMALYLGASIAAAVTVPVARGFGGWRAGVGLWALTAALAVAPWLALARTRHRTRASTPDADAAPAEGAAPADRAGFRPDRTAWALALYFGLQATSAYVMIGWLPQVFRDAGVPATTAGILFAVTGALGIPLSFVLPALAGRMRSQSGLAAGLGLAGMAGYAGLYVAPAAVAWPCALLLGLANCAFPLVLTMIGLRGRDGATVVRLSAFAQSTGYLLSIPGPIVVGVLYQHTGGWHVPLVLMMVLTLAQIVAGWLAGRAD